MWEVSLLRWQDHGRVRLLFHRHIDRARQASGGGMSDWLIPIGTIAALYIMQAIFGSGVALAVAAIALAFCVGALWATGNEKQKPDHLNMGKGDGG
jgi:hypothetical protein